MIQVANLSTMTPEIPAKTAGVGASGNGFADVFANELEGDAATGGKVLPVELPQAGNSLPDASNAAMDAAAEVASKPVSTAEELAAKTPFTSVATTSVRQLSAMVRGDDLSEGEAKPEAPLPEMQVAVGVKPLAVDAKARARAERAAQPLLPDAPQDADDVSAEASVDGEAPAAIAPELALLNAMAPSAPLVTPGSDGEQSLAVEAQAEAPVPLLKLAEDKGGIARSEANADGVADAVDTHADQHTAQNSGDRDGEEHGGDARTQRSVAELRFDLTKGSQEARGERLASVVAAKMPIAAASQIIVPEQAPASGLVAEAVALPGSSNMASTSFASNQGMRPHDFTALVDRLVEARETARGGAVNVSVMHAEFGEVSMRFRQDASGLSVSLANNDPEFMRAVTAASQAESGQMNDNGQSSRRDENSQNGGSSNRNGNGSDWGQFSGQTNMNGGGRQNGQGASGSEQIIAQGRVVGADNTASTDGIYA